MTVPKATVNKNDLVLAPQDNIWTTGNIVWMDAVMTAQLP
jgi:hypothetical protein